MKKVHQLRKEMEQLSRASLTATLERMRLRSREAAAGSESASRFKCARCEDTGLVVVEGAVTVGATDLDGNPDPLRPGKRVDRAVAPCSCRTPEHVNGVPLHLRSARLTNYRETAGNRIAIQATQEWLADRRQDLFFFGAPGRGKSRIAVTALNEAHLLGKWHGFYVYVPSLIQLQQQGFGDDVKKRDANALLDMCRAADPLCLDGLADGEAGSDYSRRILLTLYEERINAGLRTIWTSNLDLDELAQFYGDDRLLSRIAGRVGNVIEITGADQRLTPIVSPTRSRKVRSIAG